LPVLEYDVPLDRLNTLGLPARARRLLRCRGVPEVAWGAALARREGWRRTVLGGGSNVVLSGDVDGLVLRMESRGIALARRTPAAHLVRAAAGESWHGLVMHCLAQGWHGLENLALIPGSVGAAPVQNVGAYGVELASLFDHLTAWDTATARRVRLDRRACGFGYRDSIFKRGAAGRYVILDVTLRLPRRWRPVADYADVRAALDAAGIAAPTPDDIARTVIAIRSAKLPDPAVLGNAGSFFKNPVVDAARFDALRARHPDLPGHRQADGGIKLPAAWLIDRAGWKGRAQGGAAVHQRQALVLVNRGGASATDLLGLGSAIRADILRRYDVALEMEPVVL
jgi:UDP-N-acetylmuramate dehydrogenase